MSNRFNVLFAGEPDRAADVLEDMAGEENTSMEKFLRVALVNALRRIAVLESRMSKATDLPDSIKEALNSGDGSYRP